MAPGRRDAGRGALAEINVTPLVDVMLVLLIIFMVSAPMLTRGIDVNLPRAASSAVIEEDRVTVTVRRDGQFLVEGHPVVDTLLADEVRKAGGGRPDVAVYLEGDADVAYGRVLAAMDTLRQAGIERVALVTEPLPEPPGGGH